MAPRSAHQERVHSLHARLLSLSVADIAPPHVDPQVAALAAMALVDFAKSDEGKARFAELATLDGFDHALLDDLDVLAHALLGVVESFDLAPRSPRAIVVPQELETQCRARRSLLTTLLTERLALLPSVEVALRTVRLSYGPIDLALDLRTLAAHVETHTADLVGAEGFDADLVDSTGRLARALEDHLFSADTPELHQARRALHRMWTLFERSYRELAEIGREIFHHDGEDIFPTLEAIAHVSRTARHQSSSSRPATIIVEESLPGPKSGPISRRSSRRMMAVRPEAAPLSLEVLLHGASDSNLYLGFSQDVAEGGVFVATYEERPLGATVELSLEIDGKEPVKVSGQVHWTRPQGAGDDMPVGLGVRLLAVSQELGKTLQAFAARRTPIFYDD